MIGMLAVSKAGHDRETVYMIVAEDADSVYLCDGKIKTREHPKRKNKKHIQPINKGCDDKVKQRLQQGLPVSNEEIKRVIKVFQTQGGRNV